MSKRVTLILQLLAYFLAILSLVYLALFLFHKSQSANYSSFDDLSLIDQKAASLGYTLIAPYNRLLKPEVWRGRIYLLDMLGRVVHTWQTKDQPLYAVLEKNGNLLVAIEDPQYGSEFPPGGNTGIIQELDWNSKVVWEYRDKALHHDLVPLENGNVLVSIWEKTPADLVLNVKGGEPGTELNGMMWSDAVAEIDKKGQTVWVWHSFDHLNPQIDIIGQLLPRYGWTYTNGLSYIAKNPFDGEEAVLLSMRSLSTVLMVRKRDGEILWRSPKNMLNLQHDPTLLENGNILAFDNGLMRVPNPHPMYGSRVIEIDPKTNKIVWEFSGGDSVIDKVRFLGALTGGAQRLPNGNTLITNGPKGHIFEVTPDKRLVWDFLSPYNAPSVGNWSVNFLFKAKRYAPDSINWPTKIAPPIDNFTYSLLQKTKPLF